MSYIGNTADLKTPEDIRQLATQMKMSGKLSCAFFNKPAESVKFLFLRDAHSGLCITVSKLFIPDHDKNLYEECEHAFTQPVFAFNASELDVGLLSVIDSIKVFEHYVMMDNEFNLRPLSVIDTVKKLS